MITISYGRNQIALSKFKKSTRNGAGVRDWHQAGTRLASVEVTLTIMKTEDTQTHRVHTYSGGYRFRPGLKIHVNKELWTSPRQ